MTERGAIMIDGDYSMAVGGVELMRWRRELTASCAAPLVPISSWPHGHSAAAVGSIRMAASVSLPRPENPIELPTAKSFISCNVGLANSTGRKTIVFGTDAGYHPATNGDGYVTQAEAGSSLSARQH